MALTLAETDALRLPDADTVSEKLPLSFIEDETLDVPLTLCVLLVERELLAVRAPKLCDTLGLASCDQQSNGRKEGRKEEERRKREITCDRKIRIDKIRG